MEKQCSKLICDFTFNYNVMVGSCPNTNIYNLDMKLEK